MREYKILALNPGSTSTKIAVFRNEEQVMEKVLRHSAEELAPFARVKDQLGFRKRVIEDALEEAGMKISDFDAVVGRGGLLRPMAGGTYVVNEKMIEDLNAGVSGEHASNLGGVLAKDLAGERIPSYIVDPVVVDEMEDIARISGLPEIERTSVFHALNQKATARRVADELGKPYEDVNIIVAHLGGGISVGAHKKGKVIDVANALHGEGPFSPERAGGLIGDDLVRMCYSGKYTLEEMRKKLKGRGGIVAYLGTTDAREVEAMIESGDRKAGLVYEAMAYQVSKEIGACAAVLSGEVDAIVLTGGIAYSAMMTNWIKQRVSFIADVKIYAGEDEMSALAAGAFRVLRGEEQAGKYEG